ncbi:hypothetical protein BGZ80_007168 [Entomortierella chlamydospora]|uniref:Uncharacterized protein n=1 Tax=Entomortierella chlamydospora TaxID=101097 RepID=A0A9P6MZT1_9FUNG|nr:hypothetical protein BGZ80_007168 [Entomortierella chlamydospora]
MKSKPRNSKGSKKSGRKNPAMDNPIKPIHSTFQDNPHPDPTAISRDRVMQYRTLIPHEVPSPLPNQTTNGIEYPRFDRRPPTTSMETEFIEALYSDLSRRTSCSPSINANPTLDTAYTVHSDLDLPPHSSSESDDIDYEDMESYDEDRGEDGDCEDFDDDLDVYEHDDFLSSQEAILMELRREQVEFEENVRQLQQQLQRQGSLLPLSSNDGDEFESIAQSNVYSDHIDVTGDSNNIAHEIDGGKIEHGIGGAIGVFPGSNYTCNSCKDPKSSLCLENYGSIWRIAIIEALATAAATIASFNAYQYQQDQDRNDQSSIDQTKFRYFEFLPRPRPPNRPRDTLEHQYDLKSLKSNEATDGEATNGSKSF